MRRYLWLLVAPLLLTGCFNDEPNVAAPADEAAVVEDVNTENEAVNNEEENTNEADGEVEDTDDEVEASEEDSNSENNNDDDESRDTNSSNKATDTNAEATNNTELTQTQEDDAIEAVKEYAEFEDENYIYLTHLEENGEWLQVEVREEIADQDQTNLVALFRRHLATKSIEEFDFIEGDYLPVE